VIVKICGFTRPEDSVAAVEAGADWLGINFWPQSKRFCAEAVAREVAEAARGAGEVEIVGLFVNQDADDVAAIAAAIGLDRIQLHGDESPEYCARFAGRYLKAVGLRGVADVRRLDDFDCEVFVVDTPSAGYGGSGVVGDWGLAAAAAAGRRILLAGGLTPDNVGAAVAAVQPFGVDVAGGVESSPGVKDAVKMAAFVAAARATCT